MSTPLPSPDLNSGRLRVSVLGRAVPTFSYILAALGAGVSAVLIMGVLNALRFAESAGVAAVAGGLYEANVPVLISLYLGVFCGLAGIILTAVRLSVTTTTVSPPSWFFVIGGILGLLPLALLWHVQSIFIEILSPSSRGGGISEAAAMIKLLTTVSMIAAPVAILILIAVSVWPIYSRARPKWAPLAVLMLMELVLCGATVAFQLRTSWFYQVMVTETI